MPGTMPDALTGLFHLTLTTTLWGIYQNSGKQS